MENSAISIEQQEAVYHIELARPDCGTICAHPLDAVKTVKAFLKHAPLMEPGGRADFAASLSATVLSSR